MTLAMVQLLLFIAIVVLTALADDSPPLLIEAIKRRFTRPQLAVLVPVPKPNPSTDRGYVTCASGKHVPDLLRTIYFLRTEWRSRYPMSVMHCGELGREDIELITSMDEFGLISVVDICSATSTLSQEVGSYRLRGFLCKVGAMLESPYAVTLLIDVDLVWLRSPDLLFDSRLLAETGALFFRDRILYQPTVSTKDGSENKRFGDFMALFSQMGIQLNASYVQAQYHANGVSPWWRCLSEYWPEEMRLASCYGEAQDSSMVLIDKRRHPGMMKAMRKMLPWFGVGYGDKEMFWIAATVANEPFRFSPFAAGQYGDCSGQIMHYLPDDVYLFHDHGAVSTAQLRRLRPFYINAEYMVERDGRINAVGEFFQSRYTTAQLFHDPRTMRNITADLYPHNACHSLPHFAQNCTCADYDCLPMLPWITHQLAYHQWVSLSQRLDRSKSLAQYYEENAQTPHCIPVLVSSVAILNGVFHHHASIVLYQRYINGFVNTYITSRRRNRQSHTRPLSLTSTNYSHARRFSDSTAVIDNHLDLKGDGFDPRNCGLVGCPALPIRFVEERWYKEENWYPGFGRFCEPVRFTVPSNEQQGHWGVYPLRGVSTWKPSVKEKNSTSVMFAANFGRNTYAETVLISYANQSLLALATRLRQPIPKFNLIAAKPPPLARGACTLLSNGK